MRNEQMVFEVDFFALRAIENAFSGEIIKSVGGFAEGISSFKIEIICKGNKRIYGLLVFWREKFQKLHKL